MTTSPATQVVLVDGVGNGVLHWLAPKGEAVIVIVGTRRFQREADEFADGLAVYRLIGVDGEAPRIRHVNKHVAPV